MNGERTSTAGICVLLFWILLALIGSCSQLHTDLTRVAVAIEGKR